MIAVFDEVDIADLVELNGWEADIRVVGAVDVLPAARRVRLPGQEGTVKVTETIEAADNLTDRHLLHAPVALAFRVEPPSHVVERHEFVRAAIEEREELIEECLLARSLEIGPDLLVNHRCPVRRRSIPPALSQTY